MITMPYYRYLIPLELLVPVVLLALLERLVRAPARRAAVVLTVVVAGGAVFKPLDYGRGPWSNPYLSVSADKRELPAGAVIVMLGSAPMAYVIPHFPPTTRFVRPEGNLRLQPHDGLFRGSTAALAQVTGTEKLYVLFSEDDRSVNLERSSRTLGLDLRALDCSALRTTMRDRLRLCAVPRT